MPKKLERVMELIADSISECDLYLNNHSIGRDSFVFRRMKHLKSNLESVSTLIKQIDSEVAALGNV